MTLTMTTLPNAEMLMKSLGKMVGLTDFLSIKDVIHPKQAWV